MSRANASPEPVKKGRTVKVTAKVTAKFTDKKYRSVPAGVGFTVQFKASGAKKYKAVASGLTTTGRATAKRQGDQVRAVPDRRRIEEVGQ